VFYQGFKKASYGMYKADAKSTPILQRKNTLKKSAKFPKIFSKLELLLRPISGRWAKRLMLKN
jgi:hypothetical protein